MSEVLTSISCCHEYSHDKVPGLGPTGNWPSLSSYESGQNLANVSLSGPSRIAYGRLISVYKKYQLELPLPGCLQTKTTQTSHWDQLPLPHVYIAHTLRFSGLCQSMCSPPGPRFSVHVSLCLFLHSLTALVGCPDQSPTLELGEEESVFFSSTDPGTSPTLQWAATLCIWQHKVGLMGVRKQDRKGTAQNWVGREEGCGCGRSQRRA